MASISIRSVDPDIYDRLKTRAKRNHRSMEGELRAIIEAAAWERENFKQPPTVRGNLLEECETAKRAYPGRGRHGN